MFNLSIYFLIFLIDYFMNFQDSEELTRRLPNVVTMVELQNFGHADFQHGENAKIILFDQMIYFISNFINNYQANLTS